MNLREVFKRLGMRWTWAYYVNEYQYCAMYIVCRAIWIPICYYWMWGCESMNPAVLIIYPLHCLQSWYYVSMIFPMVKSRNREVKKLSAAKLTLQWFTPISDAHVKDAGIEGRDTFRT